MEDDWYITICVKKLHRDLFYYPVFYLNYDDDKGYTRQAHLIDIPLHLYKESEHNFSETNGALHNETKRYKLGEAPNQIKQLFRASISEERVSAWVSLAIGTHSITHAQYPSFYRKLLAELGEVTCNSTTAR